MSYPVFKENPDLVKVLVDGGANVNIKDMVDQRILAFAKQMGNQEIITILEDAGATED